MKAKSNWLTTRRDFLSSTAGLAATALLPRTFAAQEPSALEAKLAADPLRPQFHLLPARNWMNDPNGPIYFNGNYHMFFQYNPQAAVWGHMSWNHAISPDMMHWMHLPIAMAPTPGDPDSFGCFSGSAIAVGKRVYFIYTGVRESTPDKATIRDGSDKLQESQCLAFCDAQSDPRLVRWTKLPQPIVPAPPPGLHITGFRDPSVWKQGDSFYMTVGSGIAKVGGAVLLYRSKDLRRWTYLHMLTSGPWNGRPAANPCDSGEMWECPEFFPLDGGHVLIYSTEGKVFWQSGRLNPENMVFTAAKTGELDLGAFYAPKTQLDASGQRILWGWIPERRPEEQFSAAGWAGMMSLPRVLHLDTDGTLRIESLPALTSLRSVPLHPQANAHEGNTFLFPKANGELLSNLAPGQAFDLIMTDADNHSELLHVAYSPEQHLLTLDGRAIALAPGDLLQLHTFLDGSVIELIVNNHVAYTKRFYYKREIAPDVLVRLTANGSQSSAWMVRPISDNRLTTPASFV